MKKYAFFFLLELLTNLKVQSVLSLSHNHHSHHHHHQKPHNHYIYSSRSGNNFDDFENHNTKYQHWLDNYPEEGNNLNVAFSNDQRKPQGRDSNNRLGVGEKPELKWEDAKLERRETVLENRPNSPAVAYLTAPNYHKLAAKDFFVNPWQFCDGNSFLAGFQIMVDYELYGSAIPEWNRVAFRCETIEGAHTHNMYYGPGNSGMYDEQLKCNIITNIAAVGYGFQHYRNSKYYCGTAKVPRTMRLNCTRPGADQIIRYSPKNMQDDNWPETVIVSACPKGTALCGFRTTEIGYHYKRDCHKLRCCIPPILSLDFACCKIESPANNCEASVNWETLGTCRKGLKCSLTVQSGQSISDEHSEANSKTWDTLGTVDLEFKGDFAVAAIKIKASGEYHKADLDVGKDALDKTTETIETTEINMSDCDGSVQQLGFGCGMYDFATKHFRCLPFTSWDKR